MGPPDSGDPIPFPISRLTPHPTPHLTRRSTRGPIPNAHSPCLAPLRSPDPHAQHTALTLTQTLAVTPTLTRAISSASADEVKRS